MKALKGLVSGEVQGVWYRKSVQAGCQAAGLRGHARNLADGRVEVVLVGTAEQLEQGKAVARRGSHHARVSSVEWLELAEIPDVDDFLVL